MTVDALVVGAGPAGLASAIALARAGRRVVVCERRNHLAEGGSGLTLWPNALRALQCLGVDDIVRRSGAPIPGIVVRSWRGAVLSATSETLMLARYGELGVALHRADLVRALEDAVPHGTVRLGASLTALTIGATVTTAHFEDGSALDAAVVVGADGLRSRVREAAFGPVPLRRAGYTVWRGVAPVGLGSGPGALSLGLGAQFGLFAMAQGRAYWFASLPSRCHDAAHGELLDAYAGWHEPVQAVIAATDPADIVVTDVEDARPLRRRAAGRTVLVGDAAHPSTPALGQGACQALEDAVVLGRSTARYGTDVGGALAEYERRRVRRTNAMAVQARRMGRVGQWQSRPACWARDRLIEHMPASFSVRDLDRQFAFDPGP